MEAVKDYLGRCGFAGRVHEFCVSSATVALAAQALGCEEAHIAKTLAFFTPQGPVLIVAAGDAKKAYQYKSANTACCICAFCVPPGPVCLNKRPAGVPRGPA